MSNSIQLSYVRPFSLFVTGPTCRKASKTKGPTPAEPLSILHPAYSPVSPPTTATPTLVFPLVREWGKTKPAPVSAGMSYKLFFDLFFPNPSHAALWRELREWATLERTRPCTLESFPHPLVITPRCYLVPPRATPLQVARPIQTN